MPAEPYQHTTLSIIRHHHVGKTPLCQLRSILVKLEQLIVRLGTIRESVLKDAVCFQIVPLIFIVFGPRDVETRSCHSYSLRLHVAVNLQGLRASLCLRTHDTRNRGHMCFSNVKHTYTCSTYKFDTEIHVTGVIVVFRLVFEQGHSSFQEHSQVALLSSLGERLLRPLYVPRKDEASEIQEQRDTMHLVFICFTYRSQTLSGSSPSYSRSSDSKALGKMGKTVIER